MLNLHKVINETLKCQPNIPESVNEDWGRAKMISRVIQDLRDEKQEAEEKGKKYTYTKGKALEWLYNYDRYGDFQTVELKSMAGEIVAKFKGKNESTVGEDCDVMNTNAKVKADYIGSPVKKDEEVEEGCDKEHDLEESAKNIIIEGYDYIYMEKLIKTMKGTGKTPEEAIKIILSSGVDKETAMREVVRIYREDIEEVKS